MNTLNNEKLKVIFQKFERLIKIIFLRTKNNNDLNLKDYKRI